MPKPRSICGTVPRFQTAPSRRQNMRRYVIAAMIFLVVPIAYGLALVLKMVTSP